MSSFNTDPDSSNRPGSRPSPPDALDQFLLDISAISPARTELGQIERSYRQLCNSDGEKSSALPIDSQMFEALQDTFRAALIELQSDCTGTQNFSGNLSAIFSDPMIIKSRHGELLSMLVEIRDRAGADYLVSGSDIYQAGGLAVHRLTCVPGKEMDYTYQYLLSPTAYVSQALALRENLERLPANSDSCFFLDYVAEDVETLLNLDGFDYQDFLGADLDPKKPQEYVLHTANYSLRTTIRYQRSISSPAIRLELLEN